MPLVTICIPAYRSGPMIAATLRSVKDQAFKDFRCVVGFDPPAADQMEFVEPFLADPRFICHENPGRLGWDGNVRALMAAVESPLFMVLLHDDLIHPAYLETLVARLDADHSLSLAYTDMWLFGGNAVPAVNVMDIPETASRTDQVMAFLLQRAEAVPWRGVARASILREHAFPVDGHGGFAAECEWTLRLLVQGPAQRVPKPLYYKRYVASGTTTATQRWGDLALDDLIAAWNGHRTRMLGMIREITEAAHAQRNLLEAAAEAALLSRLIQAVRVDRIPAAVRDAMRDHIERGNSAVSDHLRWAGATSPLTARIESVRLMANALWAIWEDDREEALRLSTEATVRDPENAEALFARARVLAGSRRHGEALEAALAVLSITPHRRGLVELLQSISNAMTAEAGDHAAPPAAPPAPAPAAPAPRWRRWRRR